MNYAKLIDALDCYDADHAHDAMQAIADAITDCAGQLADEQPYATTTIARWLTAAEVLRDIAYNLPAE